MTQFSNSTRLVFYSLICGITVSVVAGCAVFGGDSSSRVAELESQLREKNDQLEDLRERKMMQEDPAVQAADLQIGPEHSRVTRKGVSSNLDSTPVPFSPSASLETPHHTPNEVESGSVAPSETSPGIRADVAGRGGAVAVGPIIAGDSGEHYLYSKVIESFRLKNRADLDKSVLLLLKTYPSSIHADNALWLQAKASYLRGESTRALGYLDRLLQQYPTANKVPSALALKAKVLRDMNRGQQATLTQKELRENFPGVPEAAEIKSKREVGDTP